MIASSHERPDLVIGECVVDASIGVLGDSDGAWWVHCKFKVNFGKFLIIIISRWGELLFFIDFFIYHFSCKQTILNNIIIQLWCLFIIGCRLPSELNFFCLDFGKIELDPFKYAIPVTVTLYSLNHSWFLLDVGNLYYSILTHVWFQEWFLPLDLNHFNQSPLCPDQIYHDNEETVCLKMALNSHTIDLFHYKI